MIIKQVINNNVVFVSDDRGQELVLMGKGIGFGKKSGERAFCSEPTPPGRTMHDQKSKMWDRELMKMTQSQYSDAYACAKKVAEYILKTTPFDVPEEEMMYLTVHIQRLNHASQKIADIKEGQ